ncbi:lipoate-protein ligase 2 [Plasmodium gonderi]|uniref:Lipoate-protein ligase 2 n=1 Tax=Plasmodium gonderi TaxID=77519 RepID=A0A1Y1JCQ3_PLAGO|nr:lipoate-protein ligase 2 [Plasmodium gonderi]GAW80299.1 lipoate-protein ligase 2 [Plasmodium gonderi]
MNKIMRVSSVHELFRPFSKHEKRKNVLYVINCTKFHVYEQLLIEECLYRLSSPLSEGLNNIGFVLINNTCLNDEKKREDVGSTVSNRTNKCVVFGLSGKVQNFIKDINYVNDNKIWLIKRYTGGGTVYINNNCLLISLILPFNFEKEKKLYPSNITEWVFNSFYNSVFNHLDSKKKKENFLLKKFNYHENDYVYNDYDNLCKNVFIKKVGGNAQAFSKNYFVHHTSFLWSCNYDEMEKVIINPLKQPLYRNKRNHKDFLVSLEECLPNHMNNQRTFIDTFLYNIRELINKKNNQHNDIYWYFNNIDLRINLHEPIQPYCNIFDKVYSVDTNLLSKLYHYFCSNDQTKNLRSTHLLDHRGEVLSNDCFYRPSFILT